jgi:hypothetical protein
LAPDRSIFDPVNFPPGPAILRLNNRSAAANPIAVQIDVPPPSERHQCERWSYDVSPAFSQDVVNVNVQSDPTVLATRAGYRCDQRPSMPDVAPIGIGIGQTQITFVLTQGFAAPP